VGLRRETLSTWPASKQLPQFLRAQLTIAKNPAAVRMLQKIMAAFDTDHSEAGLFQRCDRAGKL
jgi:3-methyladenine DNA glycosylase Tag